MDPGFRRDDEQESTRSRHLLIAFSHPAYALRGVFEMNSFTGELRTDRISTREIARSLRCITLCDSFLDKLLGLCHAGCYFPLFQTQIDSVKSDRHIPL